MSYVFEEYTKVLILPSVAALAAPTLAEVLAGVDVTPELTREGLHLVRSTRTVRRTPWSGRLDTEAAARVRIDAALQAKRAKVGGVERLWSLAVFRSAHVLIVRRGIHKSTAVAAGQKVEALRFTFGQRATAPMSSNSRVTFTVPLFVTADEDEAVLA